jgi:integrase
MDGGTQLPKLAKALSAIEVKRLEKPGLHAVGTVAGLRLLVKDSGARSWVLRTTIGARRAEMGLGGYPTVSLAQAIEYARESLQKIRSGVDPTSERRANRVTIEWTFKRTAEAYIAGHKSGWKNAKHLGQWENTLATYVYPKIGHKHVRDVTKADVLSIIEPHWTTKNETMVRVRSRIELVLNYAMQREYRPEGLNPARWKGGLDASLPKPSKVNDRRHFEALPIDDMHAFMKRLQTIAGTGARALEFAILTASRTGSVRVATWDEINFEDQIWHIPKEHMKAGRAHRVPLPDVAMDLLSRQPRIDDGANLIFPGARLGRPLSDMSLTAVMRRMKLTAVPHGFRSTFSDWCAERTSIPSEVREMVLAHSIGNETEEAYRRGDLFQKRRAAMELWAKFLETAPTTGNVQSMRPRKKG